MTSSAKLSYLRIAPRKVRLLADIIRGKNVQEARSILNFTVKKASLPLLKLLNQAVANFKNNFQTEESNLYVSKITVDEGPKHKRWRSRSRGMAARIQKKTSHILIILEEIDKKKTKNAKTAKTGKMGSEINPEEGEMKESQKFSGARKPKSKPHFEKTGPKTERGIKRMFRRKSF